MYRRSCLYDTSYTRGTSKNRAEEIVDAETLRWWSLSPEERFAESMKLWETYVAMGGSLDPEPDWQIPFFDEEQWREDVANGLRQKDIPLRVLRRASGLTPHDVRVDLHAPGEGAEAAIDTRDDVLAADDRGVTLDPLGDQLGVLDEVGGRVDHPGHEHLPGR